ncbi:MAG TPA: hypothetical protein VGQ26_24100 [Streptosporangiaceae bacterium]|nr:hypothetical protein [Streptosporangiaceae bacterium]
MRVAPYNSRAPGTGPTAAVGARFRATGRGTARAESGRAHAPSRPRAVGSPL